MNVSLDDFKAVLARLTFDRMGIVRVDGEDATRLALFAQRLLPVLAEGLDDYRARGCPRDTPEAAAFGLALLWAAPEAFGDCDCDTRGPYLCRHREALRAELKAAAA